MATNSEIDEQFDYGFVDYDSSEFYEYIIGYDDSFDSVNVVNQPNYIPYFITIIFAIGFLCGLFFGWVSAWKE